MTRIDELYERQLDGGLTAAEQTELAGLLELRENRLAWARLMALGGALAGPHPAARAGRRQPLARRRIRIAIAAVLAASVVCATGVLLIHPRSPAAEPTMRIVSCPPDATIERAGHASTATAGTDLAAGDTLHGAAACVLADGSALSMRTGTTCQPLPGRPGIRLLEGRVDVEARPRAPGTAALAVVTARGTAEVRGTRYAVATGPDRTVVSVQEGSVAFRADGASAVVIASGTGIVSSNAGQRTFAVAARSLAVDLDRLGHGWAGTQASPGLGPAFHHMTETQPAQQVWAVASPPTHGPALVAWNDGLDVTLRYDLPQAVPVMVFMSLFSAADGADFRANLQADIQLEAGVDRMLTIPASAFANRTPGSRTDHGDEVVGQLLIMLMHNDQGLVVHRLEAGPAVR